MQNSLRIQSAIRFLYPAQCLTCEASTEADFALCSKCWGATAFISGLVCDACGMPLPGDDVSGDTYCDSCLIAPRPWSRGRAAVMYEGNARKMVLALKHGDRQDMVRLFGVWMAQSARPLLSQNTLLAPVPLHWKRMISRRYNQAALMGNAVAQQTGCAFIPDLLKRSRKTKIQDGMTRDERFENARGAFALQPKYAQEILGRNVLLIDDVMTSGATLSACTEACFQAGASDVSVLVLARVARDA